jgi:hypothetical protein
MRFDPKISALEERVDLDSINMDELHGIFTAYEMKTKPKNPNIKEETFKASKSSKKKGKKKEKEHRNNTNISEDDEEMADYVRRLNKGTNRRYKGKFPLICFNCDGIGHFYNKCPHKKKKRNDEYYSNSKQTYTGKRTTKKFFKKRLCTKEDISCWKQAKAERKAILGKKACTRKATAGRKNNTHACMEDLTKLGLGFL